MSPHVFVARVALHVNTTFSKAYRRLRAFWHVPVRWFNAVHDTIRHIGRAIAHRLHNFWARIVQIFLVLAITGVTLLVVTLALRIAISMVERRRIQQARTETNRVFGNQEQHNARWLHGEAFRQREEEERTPIRGKLDAWRKQKHQQQQQRQEEDRRWRRTEEEHRQKEQQHRRSEYVRQQEEEQQQRRWTAYVKQQEEEEEEQQQQRSKQYWLWVEHCENTFAEIAPFSTFPEPPSWRCDKCDVKTSKPRRLKFCGCHVEEAIVARIPRHEHAFKRHLMQQVKRWHPDIWNTQLLATFPEEEKTTSMENAKDLFHVFRDILESNDPRTRSP